MRAEREHLSPQVSKRRLMKSKIVWFDGTIVFLALLGSFAGDGVNGYLPDGLDAVSIVTGARLLRLIQLFRILYVAYKHSREEEDEEIDDEEDKLNKDEVGLLLFIGIFFFWKKRRFSAVRVVAHLNVAARPPTRHTRSFKIN